MKLHFIDDFVHSTPCLEEVCVCIDKAVVHFFRDWDGEVILLFVSHRVLHNGLIVGSRHDDAAIDNSLCSQLSPSSLNLLLSRMYNDASTFIMRSGQEGGGGHVRKKAANRI